MKINCGIAEDLLPLYVDGICTQGSRQAVEEHLKNCEMCREKYRRMTSDLEMDFSTGNDADMGNTGHDSVEADKENAGKFRKGIRKLRRRWFMSVIAAFMVIPVLFCTVNQFRGEGICFTNLYQIIQGYRYLAAIENGQYDRAFDMIDSEDVWKSLTETDSGANVSDYQSMVIDSETWYSLNWDNFTGSSSKAGEAVTDEERESAAEEKTEAVVNGEDALAIWENILQRGQYAMFIVPEQAYLQLKKENRLPEMIPMESGETEENYIRRIQDTDGTMYYAGSYMIPLYDDNLSDREIIEYVKWDSLVVPESIWKEMYAAEQESGKEFIKAAKWYTDMGYEAWRDESKKRFIQAMEQFQEKYGSFKKTGFHAAYRMISQNEKEQENCGKVWWQMEYDLYFDGRKKCCGGIILMCRSGKIRLAGGYDYGFIDDISPDGGSAVDEFINLMAEFWYRFGDD